MTVEPVLAEGVTFATLSASRLRELVDMQAAIDVVRAAFVDAHLGSIEQPVRMALGGGHALVMAAADEYGDFAVKAVTVFPQNRGLRPVVQGVMLLFDGVTGSPQLLVDGPSLTALRTGAASGVATDLLAVDDASVLAVIGAGGQAWDQVVAVAAVRPIKVLRISSRTAESAERLRLKVAEHYPDLEVRMCASPPEAVAGADVVCTVTTATEPLFERGDIRNTAHVNALGVHTAGSAELPPELIAAASMVAVDSLPAARAEAGDLIRAMARSLFSWSQAREIGELILDPPDRSGVTVFKSVGIAAQDLAVAKLALRRWRATAKGL